jgi:hypothetical protein
VLKSLGIGERVEGLGVLLHAEGVPTVLMEPCSIVQGMRKAKGV